MCIEKIVLISMLSIFLIIEAIVISNAETKQIEKLENVAVALVIDTSGSMQKTDPKILRGTAANIFIDLLSPDDYLSIITFHTSVDVALPISKVQNSDNKMAFKEQLSPKLIAAGDTNYMLALAEAKKQLDGLNDQNVRKFIVFLTDGTPDPDPSRTNDSSFMNDYMNSFWDLLSKISLSNYPIYSVGFSEDINPQILQKISFETRGEYRGFNDSVEIASGFFQILSNLKNRNCFLDTEFSVDKEKKYEFNLDHFTSQVTLVFTYSEENPMEVSLIPPAGEKNDSNVSINKTNRYTIITLYQKNDELIGKWSVNIKGSGKVKAFGAKDLFVKSWIEKPVPNSIYSINVPIDIETVVTGAEKENLYIEAQIKKNGTNEALPVILKYSNGVYKGVYEKTDQPGTYDFEVKVFRGNQLLTESVSRVFVKLIPTLETDFYTGNKNFILGNSTIITSWLNLKGNIVKPSSDLSIEDYQIILNAEGGKKAIVNLSDEGNQKDGDILSKDGIYSGKINFSRKGKIKATLIAKGVYKGENFALEKPLSTYEVYPPGVISITIDASDLYGRKGDIVKIPFIIKNTSAYTETINISASKTYGAFPVTQISAEPDGVTETSVDFQLNKNLQIGVQEIPINISVEEPLSTLKVNQSTMKIQVVSSFEWIIKKVIDQRNLLIPILLTPLLFLILGLILYQILVYPKTIVQGTLCFYESGDAAKTVKELKLNSFKKSTVIISLNGDEKNVDHMTLNSRFNFNIVIINIFDKENWNFIEGYKALGSRKSSKLLLRTTEPGIFQYNGNVYTQKELFHGDIFETGGYTFQYMENNQDVQLVNNQDLLAGKI